MDPVQVKMLGEFSIRAGDTVISDVGTRSKKVWGLLAYLLCTRDRVSSQQKLMDLLWGEDDASANQENALRITLHRLRSLLDRLWPGAGHELIVRKDGGYIWSDTIAVDLDCDRFSHLLQTAGGEDDHRLSTILEALALYRGEFLPKQASDLWVIPISTHYQNQYLSALQDAVPLLSARGRHTEAISLLRSAVQSEPYHEVLHQLLMQELSAAGDSKGAAAVYEQLSKRLFDDFGIRPNEQTRAVYRASAHSPEDRTLPIDEVLEHLQEPIGNVGAMQCDYDYFKVLCYAESRAMERNGNATHIALLGLTSGTDKPLTKRSTDRIMEQLGEALRLNLRRGDTISRCSTSQYIIMLPRANYEDSCMVCKRVIAAFFHTHPHVAARINFMVQPLTPSICVP